MKNKLLVSLLGFAAIGFGSEPVFIFTEGPFASAHASNLVELRNGDFIATWFGGTAEGRPDVAIWGSRLHKGVWSNPKELAREPDIATYNPVMFYTKDNRLWFYYKFGPNPTSWAAARSFSDDDGVTWSGIEHLPAGVTGPIRTKPLVMNDGTVVSGTSVEAYNTWSAWIERSIDNGKSWQRIGPITVPRTEPKEPAVTRPDSYPFAWSQTYGIIQPSVVSMGGNKLRLYARSTGMIARICVADSTDAGLTWTNARPIQLPNPNSGIDVVRLRDGRVVVVYNRSTDKRTPLGLAVSIDGETFTDFLTLESGEGEFSYPAMIQDRDGNLDVTYTWNRKRIKYARIPLSQIPVKQQ